MQWVSFDAAELCDTQVMQIDTNRHSGTLQPCVQWGVNKYFYVQNVILNRYFPSLEFSEQPCWKSFTVKSHLHNVLSAVASA